MKRYSNGKPCKVGHVAERLTSSKHCVVCDAARAAAYRAANPGKNAEYSRQWRAADPERARAGVRKALAKWRPRNRHKKAAEERLRQAKKMQRTPAWADKDQILKVYEAARKRSDETGEEWHVDHIVPLQGELVSGLHVVENLQLLPGSENCRKNNSYEI